MTATIQKWGNSQGIRLPKVLLDDLDINEGEEVDLFVHRGTIVIKPSKKKRKTIQELFADYEGGYESQEMEWGEPVGEEIW
ncbi:MAG: AbrB/MazE/SpoVT family DNA-binding domain-containing protein [Clostridiales bacterium]|jgi:antitoxin MazE|nr:AbrB/MazE/SpoVT family DNA-binding domain-containing protein [Clostridiales bacterium]